MGGKEICSLYYDRVALLLCGYTHTSSTATVWVHILVALLLCGYTY